MDKALPSDADPYVTRRAGRPELEQAWPTAYSEEAMRNPEKLTNSWRTLYRQAPRCPTPTADCAKSCRCFRASCD